jgi:hypothetical protein
MGWGGVLLLNPKPVHAISGGQIHYLSARKSSTGRLVLVLKNLKNLFCVHGSSKSQ